MHKSSMIIEKAVIGLLFSFWGTLKKYVPCLSESDFRHYTAAFRILQNAYNSHKKYDEVLLLSDAYAEGVGEMVTESMIDAVTPAAFGNYFNELKEINMNRRLSNKVMELYQANNISLESLSNIVDEEKNNSGYYNASEKAIARIADYINNLGNKEPRIYTGFSLMDKVIGGFRPGTVCHIGARPSTGKTTFAINIAQKQIHKRVLFFSLEMSAEMIFDRYASNLTEVDYSLFAAQSLCEANIEKIKNIFGTLAERKNFFVLDDVYNIESIVSSAVKIKPDLIVIDYIQKVGTMKNISVMRERIEYISGELKKLAKEIGSVIICLSQLSREGQNAPTMSNLKESGALEADGDYIIILHRPFVLEKKIDISPEETEVLIDKNKFGETGLIKMLFKGKYQRFVEIDERYEELLDDM